MTIILHRQNDIIYRQNYSIEIDIRNSEYGPAITHDKINDSTHIIPLEEKVHLYDFVIANIKESGCEEECAEIFSDNEVDYQFLDSQIPDMLRLCREEPETYLGRFIVRVSDVETLNMNLIEKIQPKFAWVDFSEFSNFNIEKYIVFLTETLIQLKNLNITPILVSPELYSLNYLDITKEVVEIIRSKYYSHEYSVCTKYPDLWS